MCVCVHAQTREEGKSLLHEVVKKKAAMLDSSTGHTATENLGGLSEIELSPITANSS